MINKKKTIKVSLTISKKEVEFLMALLKAAKVKYDYLEMAKIKNKTLIGDYKICEKLQGLLATV